MFDNDSSGTQIEGAAALVTGGNRGSGRAMVEELLDRGAAKVYATARSPHLEADQRIVPLVLDVTDEDSVAAAAQAATDVSIVVKGTVVTALHVGYMDTDMTAHLDVPKADPRDIARQTADAIATGQYEVLADDITRTVRSQLSNELTNLYEQLAAA